MSQSYLDNLKQRIKQELGNEPFQKGHPRMLGKFTFLAISAITSYILLMILGPESPLFIGLPLLLSCQFFCLITAFSIMHAGSHSSFASGNKRNWLAAFTILPLGASPTLWYYQHVVMHHSFTNIHDLDHDLEAGGLIRCHPSQKRKSFHKYQHIYALFLYSLVSLKWFLGDIPDLVKNVYNVPKRKIKAAVAEIIISKTLYVFIFFVIPYQFFGSWTIILTGYLLFMLITGFALGLVFQLAHVSNVQEFPASIKHKKDHWVLHQLSTTADFAVNNRFLTWWCGGLNFQVEHHIFPGMCELYYPKVQKIVKAFAKENGMPYYDHPTFFGAIKEHLSMLKKFGNSECVPCSAEVTIDPADAEECKST